MKAIAKIADKVDRKNDETKRFLGSLNNTPLTLKGNDFSLYDGVTSIGAL